ncbi:hypothetical protein Aph01nite_65570 [Acrocarpospora phusangensis]|uniref:Uncharacterized protein n=1 Tax=Acrocarpospora phusangensis TaxID=1070424 RepID=A0A919URN7_9ACTN|nr:hypothetical protein [Acrocarpospora phusangensis]GIH28247.1 hypothetical protein Aph01nite_65570 [Acrocarpospora phusangensis]
MRLFGSRLPADVRTALHGERPLSHALTAGGGYAVATLTALHLPGGLRVPWHQVDRAVWDQEGVTVVMTGGTQHRIDLPDPGLLPETIRERVTNSILASRYVRLGEHGGVRLVARRIAGQDTVEWEFVYDPELDPADPGVRAAVEQALEEVRRALGV